MMRLENNLSTTNLAASNAGAESFPYYTPHQNRRFYV
jgi:hypothetical protein